MFLSPLTLLRTLGTLLMIGALVPLASAVRAATPGEQLLSISGNLAPQTTQNQNFYSAVGPANLRLQVTGGTADETVTATVKDGGGNTVTTLVVRNGETAWGTLTLPAGATLALHNDSSAPLNFAFDAYALDVTPAFADGVTTWSGTGKSIGLQSAITIIAPNDGLYRFTLGASAGAYQLVVDNNYLRKTVKAGSAPDPGDSVYYLTGGPHVLTVVQDTAPAQVTSWSVALDAAGSVDTLPSSESGAVLGGGSFFREEWIPIHVAQGAAVDIRIAADGGSSDSLRVELLNGNTSVFSSTDVLGGEVNWGSTALTEGANTLHLVARNGNLAPLSYAVQVIALPQVPFNWSGKTRSVTTRPAAGNASIRLTFATSGLYTFALGANAGRFQFTLGDAYIQKVVTDTTSTSLSAYVAAGTYTLGIAQDPQQVLTDWQVNVQPGSATSDVLPFTRGGGTLGTTDGEAFSEEWLPLQTTLDAPVNLKIVAGGAVSDSLRIELYNGETLKYTAATVYGGEVFWAPTSLISGTNRLHIVASGTNMRYQATVASVSDIPNTWSGVSKGSGLNPSALLNAPAGGVYDVALTVDDGAARLVVDPGSTSGSMQSIHLSGTLINVRVELTRGLHTFVVEQEPGLPRSAWSMAVSLRRQTQTLSYVYLPIVRR